MDPLLPSTPQGFDYTSNVVLMSTKFQVHNFLAMAQALSSLPVATPLQADSTVQEKIESALLADLYCTDKDADDDPIPLPPEPLPDPTTPENFGNPEEVSVYATKQPKPASHLVCHALSNQMKSSASPALKSSDAIVLQKAHYAEVCTIVSQSNHAGIDTPIHSFLAQLTWHKNSVPNLAMASGASFLPFLSAVLSAISMAYERPPAAPDPYSSATLSAFGNFMSMPLITKLHLSIIWAMLFVLCLPWKNLPFKPVHYFPAL